MADIPSISITNEFSDNDDDKTDNQIENNVATDCENLDSDSDTGHVVTGNNLVAFSKKSHKNRKGSILTDCEDMCGSDTDEVEVAYDDSNNITLEEFLDQGITNETTRYNGQNEATYDGPRRKSRCASPMQRSNLGVNPDTGAVTDYEDVDASDEDEPSGAHNDFDMKLLLDENDTVESHDNIRSVMGQHHMTTTESGSSSETSGDDHTPCKYKPKPKNLNPGDSDTENLVFSDYESCLKTRPKRAVVTDLAEDEIITLEMSDGDEAGPSDMDSVRCVDVHFRNTVKDRHKPGTRQFSKLLDVLQDPNEGLTDVENLNSSDDDYDDDQTPGCLTIPAAVVRTDYLTDVEDLEGAGSDDDDEVEGAGACITLPKPVRQLIMVQESDTGAPISKVVPLSDNLSLAADVGYQDRGLTDTEDLSDVNEDLYDISEYMIDSIPDMEAGRITSSDKFTASQLGFPRSTDDPITDTELLTDVKDTRKKRHRHRHSQRQKQRLAVNNDDDGDGLTDVEEMILSDQGNRRFTYNGPQSAAPLLTINTGDDGGHTDVELLSGDEDVAPLRGRRMQRNSSPNILNKSDWFNSAEATKESLQEEGKRYKNNNCLNMNLPRLRKLSPTPDAGQTDIEELARSGDEEDDYDERDAIRGETPAAVHRQLDENNSTTHDRNVSTFDEQSERLNIKGHQDIPEALTDTEYLEDDSRK